MDPKRRITQDGPDKDTAMTQIDGIIKERYTSEEISQEIEDLDAAGLVDLDDRAAIDRLVKEFYFRGLVHGRADEQKVTALRDEIGY